MLRDADGHLPDALVRVLSRLHIGLFRLSRGRWGARLAHNDMLLLTTTGRRSGRPHTVPLLFLREGQGLVVVASYGGRHHHPDWYRNLLADPQASVRIGADRFPVTARTSGGGERHRLWALVTAAYEGYTDYQERTRRRIPIVVLDPL